MRCARTRAARKTAWCIRKLYLHLSRVSTAASCIFHSDKKVHPVRDHDLRRRRKNERRYNNSFLFIPELSYREHVTSLPVRKTHFSTRSYVMQERRYFRFKYVILRPEVSSFRYDVTTGCEMLYLDCKWCDSGMTSRPAWKCYLSTGSGVLPAWRYFRFENLISGPERAGFRHDVTAGLKI